MELSTKEFEFKYIKAQKETKKLMIVMHGLGDSLDSYISLVEELNLDNLNYFLINAPLPYPMGSSWYDIPPGNPQEGIELSCNKIEALVAEMEEQGLKREDIFIMGFSQGGCIALEYMNKANSCFAGVIALSPRIYMDTNNIGRSFLETPVFSAHGQFDPVIPYQETASKINALMNQHANVVFQTYPMEHSICIEELNDLSEWLQTKI